jgi:hypothetical protein
MRCPYGALRSTDAFIDLFHAFSSVANLAEMTGSDGGHFVNVDVWLAVGLHAPGNPGKVSKRHCDSP